jgi:hypothetical protein
MRVLSIRAGLVAAVAMLAVAFIVPATSAMASSACASPTDSLSTCVQVFNQNLYITSVQGWAYETASAGAYGNVHIELSGPKGLIKNCAAVTVPNGGATPRCEWSPHADEKEGSYCATAWRETSPGYYQNMGEACRSVQPTP